MLQFKQRQPESEPAPARWKVGIDRQRVAAYVALALVAGFALGFVAARYLARTQPTTPAVSETAPQIRQAAADSLTGELHRVTRVVRGDTVELHCWYDAHLFPPSPAAPQPAGQ